jgi:hypothetical protein
LQVTDDNTHEHPVCWEAHTPSYPVCQGYASVGYTCVGEYCAAIDPAGTPADCAVAAGCSVDPATGRCNECSVSECADLASVTLAQTACDGVAQRVASSATRTFQHPCSQTCAAVWDNAATNARRMCDGSGLAAFEAVAPRSEPERAAWSRNLRPRFQDPSAQRQVLRRVRSVLHIRQAKPVRHGLRYGCVAFL